MAMYMKLAVFWIVAFYCLIEVTNVAEVRAVSVIRVMRIQKVAILKLGVLSEY
jgi:hypothetical protein